MPGDITMLMDKDEGWLGVNSRLDPVLVPKQYVSSATNRRFDRGIIKNRWGIVRPPWGGQWSQSSYNVTVAANSKSTVPYNESGKGPDAGTIIASDSTAGTPSTVFPNGTRIASSNESAITTTISSVIASPAVHALTYYGSTVPLTDIVGMLSYRDPQTNIECLLVASNEARSSDGGNGVIYLIRPNLSQSTVPMNGHDFYGTVRLIQAFNSVVLLRPGAMRYYFKGTAISSDVITLNVTPDFLTGTRVIFHCIGSALSPGGTTDGVLDQYAYFARVSGSTVTLYDTKAHAVAGGSTGKRTLVATASGNRYCIELANSEATSSASGTLEDERNDGTPLILQNSSGSPSALDNGFNRVPNLLSISAATVSDNTITVQNHRLVAGDQLVIEDIQGVSAIVGNAASASLPAGTYYVYPVTNNTLRLYTGTTANTDSLFESTPATAVAALTGGAVTSITVSNGGSGYTTVPEVTLSAPTSGTTATATAVLTNGVVTGFTITNAGSGYGTTAPTVTIAVPNTLVEITAATSVYGSGRKSSAYASPIPAGREGIYFQNRLLLLHGADLLSVSDVLDPLHYAAISNDFMLNTGSNDKVTALYAFNQSTVIVFKQRSILAIENVFGDLSNTRLTEITREFGCIAPLSIAGTGTDLIFLSHRGVVSLKQTEYGLNQSVVLPLSDPIQDQIADIDFSRASTACGFYFDNRYLVSVPVRGSASGEVGVNTVTLVYNFLNQAWEGKWTGTMLKPRQFERMVVSQQPTLLWSDNSGYVHTFDPLALMDRTCAGAAYDIATSVVFRGFSCGYLEHKQWTGYSFQLASWHPTYTVTGSFDGVNEVSTLTSGTTKSRSIYYTYGSGTYDTTNINDDFLNPYRQDYSFTPGLKLESGVKAGLHQSFSEKGPMKKHGFSMQLNLSTAGGSVEVYGMQATAIPFRISGRTDV